MEQNVIEALRLVRTYSGGYGYIWALAGNARRSCRKHVLEVLLGRKVKSNECGVTHMGQALCIATGIDLGAGCVAEKEDKLRQFILSA